jgi:hypothetical protein
MFENSLIQPHMGINREPGKNFFDNSLIGTNNENTLFEQTG